MGLKVVFVVVVIHLLSNDRIQIFIVNVSLTHVVVLRIGRQQSRLLCRKV